MLIMDAPSPRCHDQPNYEPNTPTEPPSEGQQRDFEGQRQSAARLTAAATGPVGSLPDRLVWQPCQTHSHGPAATPSVLSHARISGSLGNTSLIVETPEYSRPHLCPLNNRGFNPPPYFLRSPTAQAGPISPHTHKLPWEADAFIHSAHQPVVSCCSQLYPSSLGQSAGQGPGDYNETAPLLASGSRSGKMYNSLSGAKVNVNVEDSSVLTESRERSGLRRFHRKQLLSLCSMLAVVVASFATLSVMAPFFPRQVERLNLGKATDGVIFSIYPCVIFLTSPVIGKLLPLFDSRAVFLVGITLTGVADILFGLVSFINTVNLFVAMSIGLRVVAAFGTSCFLTVIYALVPIVFHDDVNVVTGMLETSIGMGMCLGPVIGMWLYSMGGFSMPFFCLGSFILLTAVINCITFPDDELRIISNHGTSAVWSVLALPRTGLSMLILCVTAVCSATLYPTLQPHMHKLGVSTEGVCMIYLLLSVMYAVSAPLVGLATDRYGGLDKFMLVGLLLTALSFILIGNSPLLPPPPSHHELYVQDIVGMVLFGLSSAMCIVPTFGSILKAVDSTGNVDMGTYSVIGGLWSATYSLGEMLGPLYAGLIADYATFASATTITAFLPAALAVVFGSYMCASRNRTTSTSSARRPYP